jgi:hypothetical protein
MDLSEILGRVEGCCLHDAQWTRDEVDHVVAILDSDDGDYGETNSITIVALKPLGDDSPGGSYGLLTESSDTTGHGCQCDAMTAREPTLRALLGHLQEHELLRLVIRA